MKKINIILAYNCFETEMINSKLSHILGQSRLWLFHPHPDRKYNTCRRTYKVGNYFGKNTQCSSKWKLVHVHPSLQGSTCVSNVMFYLSLIDPYERIWSGPWITPWRMGDAVVGRGNAGRKKAKTGHPCPCENCSERPSEEKTGRGSTNQSVTELNRFFGLDYEKDYVLTEEKGLHASCYEIGQVLKTCCTNWRKKVSMFPYVTIEKFCISVLIRKSGVLSLWTATLAC